jgi:NADPH-dependent curcumin reductase CurA
VDVYFENVGGAIWQAVLPLLNRFARVPVCGLLGHYTGGAVAGSGLLEATMSAILRRSLLVRGFINYEFADEHFPAFLAYVSKGIAEGQIRYREDVTDGLENAPAAFMGMLTGQNFGKALVKVA